MEERERRLNEQILSLRDRLESTEAELTRTRTLLNDERAERELQDNPGEDIPFAALTSPGGEVTIPTPTRADLILSAKQWAIAAKECVQNAGSPNITISGQDLAYIISCCERIEKTLTEAESIK